MVYVTGDIHGDARRLDAACRKLKKGDTLLICGDFGFLWNGGTAEQRTVQRFGKRAYNIAFVDGTHENFDLLNAYPEGEWNGGRVHLLGGNLYHLMRGELFTIEGKTFFAFGGGTTPDKPLYVEAGKWWECELPGAEDMRHGAETLQAAGFKVDYIITHEPGPRMGALHTEKDENQLDVFFETLSKKVEFQKWFFGSLHQDRKFTTKHYSVFKQVVAL